MVKLARIEFGYTDFHARDGAGITELRKGLLRSHSRFSADCPSYADMSVVVANLHNTDPTNIDAVLCHLTADELELYSLGMVKDNGHLARLEEHLLVCEYCVDRATQMDDWVTAMKSALRAQPKRMEDGEPEEPS